uniref:Attractin n=1 Tax=Nippostrongylus brasiliensis TaxID=27835 RepID=A0A0N4XNU8_NIPBR
LIDPGCKANESWTKCATCETKCFGDSTCTKCYSGCGCDDGFARNSSHLNVSEHVYKLFPFFQNFAMVLVRALKAFSTLSSTVWLCQGQQSQKHSKLLVYKKVKVSALIRSLRMRRAFAFNSES